MFLSQVPGGIATVIIGFLAGLYGFMAPRGLSDWQHSLLAAGEDIPRDYKADAIIVLGYALEANGTPTGQLRDRVDAGVDLVAAGVAANMIFSGGHPGSGVRTYTEAAVMHKHAMEAWLARGGGERGAWLMEQMSTSTRTNAVYSLQLARAKGWSKLVVVTSPYHQYRSWKVFEAAAKETGGGLELITARTPSRGGRRAGGGAAELWRQWDFFRECAAIAYYFARGWLS
mmetsp:Transcript_72619/g.228775  ORF Transcript_72619/g.228775 Transcript_72619/m.228775 type:complete len:229 (+) Transcript_72619:94-780(+)